MLTLLAIDVGCNGCFLMVRNIGNGPEVVCRPYTWWWRRRDRYDQHKAEIHDQLRFLIQEHRPRVVALEKPQSIIGFKHVGVSQAWMGAEMAMVCNGARPAPDLIVQVEPMGRERAAEGWAILRQSLSEILSREEMRELNQIGKDEPGEHVADACAVAIAGLERAREMMRGGAAMSREGRR